MARIRLMGGKYYLERRVRAGYEQPNKKSIWRNWFLVKYGSIRLKKGLFSIGDIPVTVPIELIGKRIRLVVEIMEDKSKN